MKNKIVIPVMDDAGVEPDESFLVELLPHTLKNKGGANCTVGEVATCRCYILDNGDPSARISEVPNLSTYTQLAIKPWPS